jgi:cbb3-type cytochrome oxidase subunit 3
MDYAILMGVLSGTVVFIIMFVTLVLWILAGKESEK